MKNYIKKISFLAVFALSFWGILTAFQVRHYAEVPTKADNEKNFERFLSEFPKGKLPFVLSANQLQKHLEANRGDGETPTKSSLEMVKLSYNYHHFLPSLSGGFSRMPPTAAGLMTTRVGDKHLVIYALGRIRSSFQTFYSVLYDKDGKILKEEIFAEINRESLMEGAISEDLQIKTTTYKVVWTGEESPYNRKIKQLEKGEEAVKTLLKLPNTNKQSQSKAVKKAMP